MNVDENKDVSSVEETVTQDVNKHILLTVLKRHKIGLLVILLLIMISSTFAWFIYNKTVDMGLMAHVKTWNIELGDSDEEEIYEIKIEALYPGMASIDTAAAGGGIPIHNSGEVAANISVDITSITLFGVEQVEGTDYTLEKSADGKTFTVTGYPFVLKFILASSALAVGARSEFNYTLEWDYENDEEECTKDENGNTMNYNRCDVEDTELGEASYKFSQQHINDTIKPSSLVISMKMDVTQAYDG